MVEDLDRARKRLGAFLLRHGEVWRGGSAWTLKHEMWLWALRFDDPALAATFGHYRAVVELTVRPPLAAIEPDLTVHYDGPRFADAVTRLSAYRGVARQGAMNLASEVCDWRRVGQASGFLGFTGLCQYSSRFVGSVDASVARFSSEHALSGCHPDLVRRGARYRSVDRCSGAVAARGWPWPTTKSTMERESPSIHEIMLCHGHRPALPT